MKFDRPRWLVPARRSIFRPRVIHRVTTRVVDGALCAAMNVLHARHRLGSDAAGDLDAYLAACERLDQETFFARPEGDPAPVSDRTDRAGARHLVWPTPFPGRYAANNWSRATWFCPDPARPAMLILHALMSVNDLGYERTARRLAGCGWSALFFHLPWHYSRTPFGFANGELAVSCDLVRTGESLRQAVVEIRLAMAWLRALGVPRFGLWATSWGGWIGALLAAVEPFSDAVFMAPILNVHHAIWESPVSKTIRARLSERGITADATERHGHLTSPARCRPLVCPDRILILSGIYDEIAPRRFAEEVADRWGGAGHRPVAQGHFGYRMTELAHDWIEER